MRSVTLTETTTKEVCRLQFPDSMSLCHVTPVIRAALLNQFNPHIAATHALEAEFGPQVFDSDIYDAPDGGESIYNQARAKRPMVSMVAMAVSGFKGPDKKALFEMHFEAEDDVSVNRINSSVALFTIGTNDAKSLAMLAQEQPAPTRAPEPVNPTPLVTPKAEPAPKKAAEPKPQPAKPTPAPAPEPEPTHEESYDVEAQAEHGGAVDGDAGGEPEVTDDTYTEVKPNTDANPVTDQAVEDFDPAAQAALSEANKRRTRRF